MVPKDLPHIRNVTISGRIGSGTTTLATGLTNALGWNLLEGGKLFEEFHKEKMNDQAELAVDRRPDDFDLQYEEKIKRILREETHRIIQSHLAGFDAQGIEGVFKILVVCEDEAGRDKTEVRIDRLINRKGVSVKEGKREIKVREQKNLEKWRRLYAGGDPTWVYWDKKYYDLVINTFTHNKEEALEQVLTSFGIK